MKRFDPKWITAIVAVLSALVAAALSVASFNGRLVYTETCLKTVQEDLGEIKSDVKAIWREVVQNAGTEDTPEAPRYSGPVIAGCGEDEVRN